MAGKAADVKFEFWFDERAPITGKFTLKDRVLTEGEWGLLVEAVQALIWKNEKYERSTDGE